MDTSKSVAIVTGASQGIGRATAIRLARDFSAITLAARDRRNLEAAAAAVRAAGAEPLVVELDLSAVTAPRQIVDQTLASFGRIDALLNIAGAFTWQTIADGDAATWDRMYELNVKTALNASKAALPYLVASPAGRIVNIGAGAAFKAGAGMGAYAAAKAGVARLTEALAAELLDRGVTVNALLPSIIDTPPNRADMPDADFSRWVRPEQLAATIGFLLSTDAQAITGASIPVSGRVA